MRRLLKSIQPVLVPALSAVRSACAEVWFLYRTWGLHGSHPDHGRVALRRAALRGGVRVR